MTRQEILSRMCTFSPNGGTQLPFSYLAQLTDKEIVECFDLHYLHNFVYVCSYGHDYEGVTRFSCDKYSDCNAALEAANKSNAWSEGIVYVVHDENDARIYCEEHNMKFDPYTVTVVEEITSI